MNRLATTMLLLPILLAACATAGRTQTAATSPAYTRTTPATAYVVAEGREKLITFVGRKDRKLAFTDGSGGGGQVKMLDVDQVEAAVFKMDVDQAAVFKAVRKRHWDGAIAELLPAIRPTLMYLDLPENNAASLALDLGDYIMRGAEQKRRSATTDEDKQSVRKKYEAAYAVLKYTGKADWTSTGTIASLKAIKCLQELSKPKTAKRYFEDLEEPMVGDAAFGLYWLVKAEMAVARDKFHEAMDGAVKSLCFESKNADTFPDALLLSARCYEEMQEWHRARDVYYEVARIFPRTDWSDAAAERLTFIMDEGLTDKPETAPIENVFFAFQEDMNAAARELLEKFKSHTGEAPEPEDDIEDDLKEEEDLDKEEEPNE